MFSLNVEGRVADIQRLPEGVRVVLEAVRLKGNGAPPPEATPLRLRVSLTRGMPEAMNVGDRILVLANLSPPAVIERGKPDGLVRSIDALRANITERIMKALPGPEGGVVAALLAGEQTAVDKDTAQAMRDSGLAHILSISGLHIVFVVGLVMELVRYGIALVPPLALRVDAKKIAAVLALAAALFYTALAGAPVPAQRASIMAASRCLPSCSTARRCRYA